MGLSRRQFTKEFKLAAVAKSKGVDRGGGAGPGGQHVLHRWRRTAPRNVFPGNGKPRWLEGRIAELERKVG